MAAAGLKQLYQVWAVGSGLLLSGLAALLASFAVRVLRSGRVPPPGMRVVWTTRLRTGASASLIAGASLALAVGLLLGGPAARLSAVELGPGVWRLVCRAVSAGLARFPIGCGRSD